MKNIKYSLLLASLLAVSTTNATFKKRVSKISNDTWTHLKANKLSYGIGTASVALSGFIAYDIIKNGENSRTFKTLKATGLFTTQTGKLLWKKMTAKPWIAAGIIATTSLGSVVLCDLFAQKESKNSFLRKGYTNIHNKFFNSEEPKPEEPKSE